MTNKISLCHLQNMKPTQTKKYSLIFIRETIQWETKFNKQWIPFSVLKLGLISDNETNTHTQPSLKSHLNLVKLTWAHSHSRLRLCIFNQEIVVFFLSWFFSARRACSLFNSTLLDGHLFGHYLVILTTLTQLRRNTDENINQSDASYFFFRWKRKPWSAP